MGSIRKGASENDKSKVFYGIFPFGSIYIENRSMFIKSALKSFCCPIIMIGR